MKEYQRDSVLESLFDCQERHYQRSVRCKTTKVLDTKKKQLTSVRL